MLFYFLSRVLIYEYKNHFKVFLYYVYIQQEYILYKQHTISNLENLSQYIQF